MKIKKKNLILLLLTVLLLGSAVGIAGTQAFLSRNAVLVSKEKYKYDQQLEKRFAKLNAFYTYTAENYYTKVSEKDLETGMYKGLLAGLKDPYSYYMTAEETEAWMDSTLGSFEGIGVQTVETDDHQYFIVGLIPNTPAEDSELKVGDRLLKVDGKAYDTLSEFADAMRGEKGTKVTLTYQRGKETRQCTLVRESITEQSIYSKMMKDKIGYIQITGFQENTADDFKSAALELTKKGAKAMVIDLRNNGGGLTDSSVEIADFLLGKGVITYMEDRSGKKTYYRSDREKISMPYTLLVNEQSASAAELLAAAVKDDGKNKIVGTRTFGKGIVQKTTPLKTGDSIKLTISQYYSPKGKAIHKKGVEPDYTVENNEKSGEDLQLKKAVELLKQK